MRIPDRLPELTALFARVGAPDPASWAVSQIDLLEDPRLEEPELGELGWGLFQTDAEGNAVAPIGGLHESVLETDPTGREMRPGGA